MNNKLLLGLAVTAMLAILAVAMYKDFGAPDIEDTQTSPAEESIIPATPDEGRQSDEARVPPDTESPGGITDLPPEGHNGQESGVPGRPGGQGGLPEGQGSPGIPGGFPGGHAGPGGQGGMPEGQGGSPGAQHPDQQPGTSSAPTEITESTMTSAASELGIGVTRKITMGASNSKVVIDSAGTYIVTGKCNDGSIKIKKGVTGVVLILKDLTLTSTQGAPVSCNKFSQVKIYIEGQVDLRDAEDPSDEDSSDADTADAFDGAGIKIKDGADVFITGSGTLNIDASGCKNGIKSGDDPSTVLIIDGSLTVNIDAANDGINAGYDLSILSGTVNISAKDDAIHADRILTLGRRSGIGPSVNIGTCSEGLEGAVVNMFGGSGNLNAADDAVNAADKDRKYSSQLTYSINITGGKWVITSSGDGLDSNGNINITGGDTVIHASYNGGEAGIDYQGSCYIADGTLNNSGGISFDSGSGGTGPGAGWGNKPGEGGPRPGSGNI